MNINNKIIAHRGIFNNKTIVENTMEAFEKAIEKEIPFELDVQLTKDDKIVVFHDDDLKRLTNKRIVIQDTNYDELKDIKLLDTNAHIPLLKNVLKKNKDKVLIDIEIKNSKRWKTLVNKLMIELKPYVNYIIKSFNPRIVRYIKKNYSWVNVGLLVQDNYPSKIKKQFNQSKAIINYCNPDFIAISKKLVKTDYMKKIKNKQVFIWTINNLLEIPEKDSYIYICNIPPLKK
ncbi:MAG: hypothetical protein IJG68_04380 [Bacilli bacterium]|nr:hypothetical protein [Bacilli bacterium]